MKKYLSVMTIASRSTLNKLLALLAAMAAIQSALFFHAASSETLYTLEALVDKSHIPLLSGVFFLGICALLSFTGIELSGSKIQYTIHRLSVREEVTTILWGLYNILCLTLFWSVQLSVVLYLGHWYVKTADPSFVNDQTVFLAFYRHRFLHALLPLEDISLWIRNILLILSLGTASAVFSYHQRRKKRGKAIILLSALTFWIFPSELGNAIFHMIIAALSFSTIAYTYVNLYRSSL